jgi:hypothetical protein
MKISYQSFAPLIALAAALCLASAQAAEKVYQRTDNDEAIELSNIDDADPDQMVVTEAGTAASGAAAQTAENPRTGSADGRSVREAADTRSNENSDKKPESRSASGAGFLNSMDGSASAGASMGSFNYGATSGGNGSASSGGSSAGTGSAAGTGTGAGSTGAPGASPTTGTAVAGATVTPRPDTASPTAAPAPSVTPDSALAANLQQYRDLMIQEAAAANINNNQAVSRRYLAVDRSTYMSIIAK